MINEHYYNFLQQGHKAKTIVQVMLIDDEIEEAARWEKYKPSIKHSESEWQEIFPEIKELAKDKIAELEEDIVLLEKRMKSVYKRFVNADSEAMQMMEIAMQTFIGEEYEKKIKSLKYFKQMARTKKATADSITDEDIEKARRTPVEEILNIKLQPAGINRKKGLCPFHAEDTASFVVYPDGYKCFGCGEHGNAIDYLMKIHNLNFQQAVKQLIN